MRRQWLVNIALGISLGSTSNGFADGGTSSGGGRLFKDLENPWFLGNTPIVRYCIDLAPSFGAELRVARSAIRGAIEYWTRTLQDVAPNWYRVGDVVPADSLRLGTQIFVEEECSSGLDLRFLLGGIPEADRAYVADPTEYVAVTARTDYDKVSLRGKGFIYVAPEAGPLRPDFPQFAAHPWSSGQGRVLRYVLTHELGHIFGVSHAANGTMKARMPEELADERIVRAVDTMPGVATYYDDLFANTSPFGFLYRRPLVECSDSGTLTSWRFFSLGADARCWRLTLSPDNGGPLVLESSETEGGPFTLAGRIENATRRPEQQTFIYLWITPDQRVFRHLPPGLMGSDYLFPGTREVRNVIGGTFRSSRGGEERPVFIELLPDNEVRIGGVLDNRMNTSVYENTSF